MQVWFQQVNVHVQQYYCVPVLASFSTSPFAICNSQFYAIILFLLFYFSA